METSTFDESTTGGEGEGTSPVMEQHAEQEPIPQQEEMMPPVLAEKKKPMNVLVAIDDSEESLHALEWALDNLFPSGAVASSASTEPADQTQNLGVLYLLNVQQPFQNYVFPGPLMFATTSVIESVRKGQEQNSTNILSGALKICKQRTVVKVETLMMEDMICQAADHMDIDLLVVGSRGLGQIKRAFLGSVSDYCAHHTKCPVLIVKSTTTSIYVGQLERLCISSNTQRDGLLWVSLLLSSFILKF
ncbi:hypothetical protein MKW94_001204 [Papaver nudicaule]|uniref:UspA domain-containing protein n=1 Tax=Papaver nudicaule TaxID=74823 RepID=A0AA41VNJ6_PAPNU|nr:hypothetical protein [Papaver nudicaule]